MNEIRQYLNFPTLSAHIAAVAESDIEWNSFPGSVIHGVLGFELKRMSCVTPDGICRNCCLSSACPYGLIFESPLPPNAQRMKLYPQMPHPIRIVVHPWDRIALVKGQSFDVRITLVGKATAFCLLVLLALDKGFSEGIGKKIGSRRGIAKITTVADIFNNGIRRPWNQLKEKYINSLKAVLLKDHSLTDAGNLVIDFLSPTKIITDSRQNYYPEARDLLSTLIRRISNLAHFYGGLSPELDFAGMLDSAEALKTEVEFKKIPAQRYSSRQKKAIDIEGIVGTITIYDCPPEIGSIFKAGQFLGIGKGTTMGFGDYKLRLEQ